MYEYFLEPHNMFMLVLIHLSAHLKFVVLIISRMNQALDCHASRNRNCSLSKYHTKHYKHSVLLLNIKINITLVLNTLICTTKRPKKYSQFDVNKKHEYEIIN